MPQQRLRDRAGVRTGLIALALLAAVALAAGLGLTGRPPSTTRSEIPTAAPPQTDASTAPAPAGDCLRIAAEPPDHSALSAEAYWGAADAWAAACRRAIADGDDSSRLKVALAQALRHEQRPEQVALLRAAAAQNDAEANYLIYDSHRSWDQHLAPPPLISRAEADRALRRAAELRDPRAMFHLALLLERGGIVKRDAAAARYWAEQALSHPPPDVGRANVAALLGRLLAESDQPDEHARGVAMLERLSDAGVFGANASLGRALRRDDPARARALLEQALRRDPGGAAPALAQMLIAGEGGPAAPQRAVKLLTGNNDIGAIEGARGRLMLDGRLLPSDIAKAIELIRHEGVFDYAARQQLVALLAAHPEVRIERPELVLYDATIAAELDEPGATAALIALKLSQHPQFRDAPGGCRLAQTAAASGDPAAAQLPADCRRE